MGGPSITYNPPVIEKDDTFAKFLEYQKGKEEKAETEAIKIKAEEAAAKEKRSAMGAQGFDAYKQNIQDQLERGLVTYEGATSLLRDYGSKYDIDTRDLNAPSPEAAKVEGYKPRTIESEIGSLGKTYFETIAPARRKSGIGLAYQELLGREATEEEFAAKEKLFSEGTYNDIQQVRDSIARSSDELNKSYIENYYDTQFGKQTEETLKGAEGKPDRTIRTGKRTFTFSPNLLPSAETGLATGVKTPVFGESFTGTPEEINQQLSNIRDTRQFLYSAGLTNLQGEIDKTSQKIKNQGSQKVAEIQSKASLYGNLMSGFWG